MKLEYKSSVNVDHNRLLITFTLLMARSADALVTAIVSEKVHTVRQVGNPSNWKKVKEKFKLFGYVALTVELLHPADDMNLAMLTVAVLNLIPRDGRCDARKLNSCNSQVRCCNATLCDVSGAAVESNTQHNNIKACICPLFKRLRLFN